MRHSYATKREALEKYASGLSVRETALAMKLRRQTVGHWVQEAGIGRQVGTPPAKLPSLLELWDMHRRLGNWRAVARQCGAHLSTVLRRANALVVPMGRGASDGSEERAG